ncbi:hypothetical protein OS493_007000 [Desmophyllum pertusum]|uniref:Uncharacterized protein n=1 Tax=Desmophyllum pertusum TaxID=174260 RepID=A0A9W9ZFZ2_9CNID|nr:hypothetical protein OS493_007000 [Desmophyllum pertusum]
MVASQSGFDLRFLFAVVRPTAHTRKETQLFADNLSNTNVPQLHDVYKAIYDDHKHGDVIYTLNDSALALYDQFDEHFCQKLNDKWRNGHMLHRSATEGGKERRLVLRLSVLCKAPTVSVLWASTAVVPEAYMKYAINLMAYFQQQRKEIDQIKLDEQEESHDHICDKLITFPGPVCSITNFRASASSKARKKWTPPVVRDAMDKLANSEDQTGIGEVITFDRNSCLCKAFS